MGTDETHDAMECFVSPVVAGNLSPLGMASCRNNTPHNARARCALSLVSTTRLCVAQHTRVLHALARLSPSRKRGDVAVVPRKQSWLAALGRVCPSGSVLTHHARLSHDGRVWLRHARARCRCAAVRLTPTSSVVRRLDLTQFLFFLSIFADHVGASPPWRQQQKHTETRRRCVVSCASL
jgi:hypothetical protein